MRCNLTIIAVLILLTPVVSLADDPFAGESDWTQFQYNAQHTGYNDKDKISIPLTLKWARKYQDYPFNAVSVVGDRILASTGYYEYIIYRWTRCIDLATGDELWNDTIPTEGGPMDLSQPSYGHGMVYTAESVIFYGTLIARDFVTGEPIWRSHIKQQGNCHLAPTIYRDKVLTLYGTNGGIACWDAHTGEGQWWNQLYFTYWAPTVWNDVVYTFVGTRVTAFDLQTGEKLWEKYEDEKGAGGESLTGIEGVTTVLDTLNGILYSARNILFHALDINTQEWLWEVPGFYAHGKVSVTPVIYGDMVFAIDTGKVVAFNGLTGEQLWKHAGDWWFWYEPVIANGYLFAASDSQTVALDIATGTRVWSYPVGGQLSIANNRLFIGARDGRILVFESVATDAIAEDEYDLPSDCHLAQNHPNPFNPTTTIQFDLPVSSHVRLDIHDVLGRRVRTLVSDTRSAGSHSVKWDGKDRLGTPVASGVYFYHLVANDFVATKKMVLVK